jgi:hypothetical protein
MRTLPNAGRTRILATMGRIRAFRFCAGVMLATLLLAAVLGAPRGFAQATAPNEYQVKAAFLYNFPKFIDWPSGAFPDSSSPFTICLLGHDPFGRSLEDLFLNKTINGRRTAIARAQRVEGCPVCQIIFVSSQESPHLTEIAAALRGRNVLLVGESEEFAGAGGTIQFFIQDNRVRFVINTDAADRAGLKISSKLLALASIVHETRAGGKN